ncbi:MAG: hypothetical protein ACI8X3_002388, partial [Saprospiraceae bacterium]
KLIKSNNYYKKLKNPKTRLRMLVLSPVPNNVEGKSKWRIPKTE